MFSGDGLYLIVFKEKAYDLMIFSIERIVELLLNSLDKQKREIMKSKYDEVYEIDLNEQFWKESINKSKQLKLQKSFIFGKYNDIKIYYEKYKEIIQECKIIPYNFLNPDETILKQVIENEKRELYDPYEIEENLEDEEKDLKYYNAKLFEDINKNTNLEN